MERQRISFDWGAGVELLRSEAILWELAALGVCLTALAWMWIRARERKKIREFWRMRKEP
jgi:hypothetical protein